MRMLSRNSYFRVLVCFQLIAICALVGLSRNLSAQDVLQRKPQPGETMMRFPIDASVVFQERPLPNVFAKDIKVKVRNTSSLAGSQGVAMTLQAILIRRVYWSGHHAAGAKQWRTLLPGATTELGNGEIKYQEGKAGQTSATFETGLLFPGEEISIDLPITPQRDGKHELVVEYVSVDPGNNWSDILLPDAEGVFRAATSEQMVARNGTGGGNVIVRSTALTDAKWKKRTLPVQIDLGSDTTFSSTGGISYIEASRLADISANDPKLWCTYREPLKAWFFVQEDGTASALVKEHVANPKLPPKAPPGFVPKDYRWSTRTLPRMSVSAPELISDVTPVLVPPGYEDLVEMPKGGDVITELAPGQLRKEKLWTFLDRVAAEKFFVRHYASSQSLVLAPNWKHFD